MSTLKKVVLLVLATGIAKGYETMSGLSQISSHAFLLLYTLATGLLNLGEITLLFDNLRLGFPHFLLAFFEL